MSVNVTCMDIPSEKKVQEVRATQKIVPVYPLRILCKDLLISSQTIHNLFKPSNIKFTGHRNKKKNLSSSGLILEHLKAFEFTPVNNCLISTPFSRLDND